MGAPDGPEQRARPAQKTLFPKIFGGLIPIPKRWRLRRAGRSLALIALGMALGSLLLAYLSAGEIYEYQDSVDGVHLPPVDAIVCLAGGRGRIAAAGDIW